MSNPNNEEDFEVLIKSNMNDGTTIITSAEKIDSEWLAKKIALSSYDPKNYQYSAYLKDGSMTNDDLDPDVIDNLADNPQNDLQKVLRINTLTRKMINQNDIVGKTVECIETNINTDIRHNYDHIQNIGRNKAKRFEAAKTFIHTFDDQIKLKQYIRKGIITPYIEGTFISYLRHKDDAHYVVDCYPLGVCEIADYDYNGEPIVLMNMRELRSRLSKSYKKTKKNKPLFFNNIEEEIKANYPKEVYDAYINKESYAILDPKYTGVVRINNLNRKYGVTPIFRAFKDLNMLQTFDNADRITAKANAKKIIFQKMRKECMGQDYNKGFFEELAYAHNVFMQSWAQPTVVVTAPPTVESISYVEPSVEMTSKDTYNIYRSKVLATLGISFLMDSSSQNISTATISVTQLLRTINTISEQLEDILRKWYYQVLKDNSFLDEFVPDVKIIDSEELENAIKLEMAKFLYSTMNASYETCYGMLGISVKDEANKRVKENSEGYDIIFKPHGTAYTNSGKQNDVPSSGRPQNNDPTKEGRQQYDKTRNANL